MNMFGMHRWEWILWVAFVLSACSPVKKSNEGKPTETSIQSLALPEVPVMLTAPEDRAAYVLAHFWDGLNTGDTAACHNPDFMEQNVVNFLSLFPHAEDEARAEGIGAMLQRVAADTATFHLVTGLVERYLADPNSPMRCEEYFITYLEELLRLPLLSETERLRPAHRLEVAKKNRIGTVAADFSYMERNGKRGRMHATASDCLLLLVFYDPACEHCSEILQNLCESSVIGQWVANQKLTILAIYTEGDRELWNRTKEEMPEAWRVGIDMDDIVVRGIYDVPAMPVLYLLAPDKTVLLKDATVLEIEDKLSLLHF